VIEEEDEVEERVVNDASDNNHKNFISVLPSVNSNNI